MMRASGVGHIGGALLLDARHTAEREIPTLARFFAQFVHDRLDGGKHDFASVAERVHLVLTDPHESARAAAIGADLARNVEHLGFGDLRWRLFHLPAEREALMAVIEAARSAPAKDGPSPADDALRLQNVLDNADPSAFLRQWPVYEIAPEGDTIAFEDADVDLAAASAATGVAITGNPWLVECASSLIERRALRDFAGDTSRVRPICLRVTTRFAQSPEFAAIRFELPPAAKDRLILDFTIGDVHANPDRFGALLGVLRPSGIRVALSHVPWSKADQIEPLVAGVDWLKGRFDPAVSPAHALLKFGAARCVADDLPDLARAKAAVEAGFVRITGPGADALFAERRSRALLAGRDAGQAR